MNSMWNTKTKEQREREAAESAVAKKGAELATVEKCLLNRGFIRSAGLIEVRMQKKLHRDLQRQLAALVRGLNEMGLRK